MVSQKLRKHSAISAHGIESINTLKSKEIQNKRGFDLLAPGWSSARKSPSQKITHSTPNDPERKLPVSQPTLSVRQLSMSKSLPYVNRCTPPKLPTHQSRSAPTPHRKYVMINVLTGNMHLKFQCAPESSCTRSDRSTPTSTCPSYPSAG